MIVKFFHRGKENGDAPIKYCLDAGKERERPPEVLAGDPETTCALIDACPHVYRYKSGVINFGTDKPTEEEQRAVMEDFERAAFAGLEKDQYNILWVRHIHNGQTELHFVTPRMELTTGKSLNIAPPGHEKYYNLWRDSWNLEKGWRRPDDPEKARTVRLTSGEIKEQAAGKENAKDAITAYLIERVSSGEIAASREGIKSALQELGEITREGKDYISIKIDGADKAIRLKGAIYERDFKLGKIERGDDAAGGRAEETRRRAAEEARRRSREAIERAARANAERYKARRDERVEGVQRGTQSEHAGNGEENSGEYERSRGKREGDREKNSVDGADRENMGDPRQGIREQMDNAHSGNNMRSSRDSSNSGLGMEQMAGQSVQRHNRSADREAADGDIWATGEESFQGRRSAAGTAREEIRISRADGGWGRPLYSQKERTAGELNDGIGENIKRAFDRIGELIRKAADRIRERYGNSTEIAGRTVKLCQLIARDIADAKSICDGLNAAAQEIAAEKSLKKNSQDWEVEF